MERACPQSGAAGEATNLSESVLPRSPKSDLECMDRPELRNRLNFSRSDGGALELKSRREPRSTMKLMPKADGIAAEYRYLFLFLILFGNLLLFPYAGDGGLRYQWFRVLGLGLTFFSVYAVSFRRWTLVVALLLAIPAAMNRVIVPKQEVGTMTLIGIMLTFAFDIFVLVTIFRRIFRFERVTSSTIFGALCIYLLIGFSFANLYSFAAKLQPEAFYLIPGVNLHKSIEYSDFIYYSFGTMTSLGSSGIIPVTPQVRSLTIVESILGLLYLAVLVSRLVGMYHAGLDHRVEQNSTTNP
jgi:Ion channel